MSNDIECPYCEHDFKLCTDDGMHQTEGNQEQTTCPSCDKIFLVDVFISFDYDGVKADCLNGGACNFNQTVCCSHNGIYLKCGACGKKENGVKK